MTPDPREPRCSFYRLRKGRMETSHPTPLWIPSALLVPLASDLDHEPGSAQQDGSPSGSREGRGKKSENPRHKVQHTASSSATLLRINAAGSHPDVSPPVPTSLRGWFAASVRPLVEAAHLAPSPEAPYIKPERRRGWAQNWRSRVREPQGKRRAEPWPDLPIRHGWTAAASLPAPGRAVGVAVLGHLEAL